MDPSFLPFNCHPSSLSPSKRRRQELHWSRLVIGWRLRWYVGWERLFRRCITCTWHCTHIHNKIFLFSFTRGCYVEFVARDKCGKLEYAHLCTIWVQCLFPLLYLLDNDHGLRGNDQNEFLIIHIDNIKLLLKSPMKVTPILFFIASQSLSRGRPSTSYSTTKERHSRLE